MRPDIELAVMRAITTHLPRVRGSGRIPNLLKAVYARKARPAVIANVRGFSLRLRPSEFVDGWLLFGAQFWDEDEIRFIERNLPPWMQQAIRDPEGQITYPNGSIIMALPGGANKVRGKTPTVIVLDEMAFLEEAKATYTAIAPLVQKGAQLICLSTPNGGAGNFFYHLWHGLALDAVTPVEAG